MEILVFDFVVLGAVAVLVYYATVLLRSCLDAKEQSSRNRQLLLVIYKMLSEEKEEGGWKS